MTLFPSSFSVDVYSFLQTPLQSPNTNVASILKIYSGTNETILLSQTDTAKVLCALSHQADNLFCNAADRLSLPALLQFLKSLCRASRDQLYRSSTSKKGVNKLWWPSRAWKQKNDSLPLSLLLHRVGDVTLRVFRSSRPLLHILKVWAITGPHLMDVSISERTYPRSIGLTNCSISKGRMPQGKVDFKACHRVHPRCDNGSAG